MRKTSKYSLAGEYGDKPIWAFPDDWLPNQKEQKEKLKWKGNELHLYDFDGTLFKTPEYKPEWWKAPGQWSWFAHPVAMTEPCIPLRPSDDWWIASTVADAVPQQSSLKLIQFS